MRRDRTWKRRMFYTLFGVHQLPCRWCTRWEANRMRSHVYRRNAHLHIFLEKKNKIKSHSREWDRVSIFLCLILLIDIHKLLDRSFQAKYDCQLHFAIRDKDMYGTLTFLNYTNIAVSLFQGWITRTLQRHFSKLISRF